jgi:hypothetical protein
LDGKDKFIKSYIIFCYGLDENSAIARQTK